MADRRLARLGGAIGALLLSPIFALYGLWVIGGRCADRRGQRRHN